MALDPATQEFLEKRNDFRDRLAAAILGEGLEEQIAEIKAKYEQECEDRCEDTEEDENPVTGETPEDATASPGEVFSAANEEAEEEAEETSTACETLSARCVTGRDGKDPCSGDYTPDVCALSLKNLNELVGIECFRDENGWPASAELESSILAGLNGEMTAAELIPLIRQMNVLESYRKMLLHKKQGSRQYFAAWCSVMKREADSQEELSLLMQGKKVGRGAVSTSVEDSADNGNSDTDSTTTIGLI